MKKQKSRRTYQLRLMSIQSLKVKIDRYNFMLSTFKNKHIPKFNDQENLVTNIVEPIGTLKSNLERKEEEYHKGSESICYLILVNDCNISLFTKTFQHIKDNA